MLRKLKNCFVFVVDSNNVMSFSCPLAEYYYRREWVNSNTGINSTGLNVINFPIGLAAQSIVAIFLAIIEQFEISSFSEYYSSGSNGVLKEAMWQHLFFQACCKFFPNKVHPEIGACFNTRGNCQFRFFFSNLLLIRLFGFLR